jgi:hypothetical protein
LHRQWATIHLKHLISSYKNSKKKKNSADPEGQMLAAMLIAQDMNKDGKPIYGAWLTGSTWIFTVLHEKNYYFSNNFDATNKVNLNKIVFILRKLKELVL